MKCSTLSQWQGPHSAVFLPCGLMHHFMHVELARAVLAGRRTGPSPGELKPSTARCGHHFMHAELARAVAG